MCVDCDLIVVLCPEPECVESTVTFGGRKHLPSHGMFKVHRHIFSRDIASLTKLAKAALDSAREIIRKKQKPMLECLHCMTSVSLPCWCCGSV
jgi:hypothetical protein